MAPSGPVKPAASRRNAPPVPQAAALAVTRVRNAKDLRRAYIELQQSPDGADPDPLTLPKCVECAHCGWPVYPRDSKIATKKTFARAGIERGSKKQEDEKKKNAPKAEGAAEDAESSDSRDTVERMADDLEDLKDKNDELEKRAAELELQNEALTKELKETKEALTAAEERIEFMEEAEQRWREKLSQARLEIERLKQVLERASLVSADREGGLVKTLLELRALQAKFATFVRRRNFMLRALERRLEDKENEDHLAATLRLWRTRALRDKLRRQLEELEVRRQREVAELGTQVSLEREHVATLRATRERLQARLKQAGHRLLRRALGAEAWPSSQDHAFRALVAMHPVNALENALEFCKGELERTTAELEETGARAEGLQEERNELHSLKEVLLAENQRLKDELAFLKEQMGGSLGEMESRRKAQEEKERQHEEALTGWAKKLQDVEASFAEEREELEAQAKVLESRLAVAEAAVGVVAGGPGEDDDPSRVVPKGQGVLCMGCLKQLVHRAVKPLPPVAALHDTGERQERAKREFFQKELQGVLSPDDELHGYAFNARRDPYGISRLTMHPPSAITKPSSPAPPAADLPCTPTTGLPALKKRAGPGSATALRASMREFRPRNFR